MTRNKYHGIKSAQTNMIALIIIYILFQAVDLVVFFFFQAEDGIRDVAVTGVQTCALPICCAGAAGLGGQRARSATGKGHRARERCLKKLPGASAAAEIPVGQGIKTLGKLWA